jgi:general L-amino acid transport system substrate-binding protein
MRYLLSGLVAAVTIALCSASAQAQTANTPAVNAPAANTPVVNAPAANTPAANTPAANTVAPVLPAQASATPILDAVRATGHLPCGVAKMADDWDLSNLHGDLSLLGADICRAVTIAILGDFDGMVLHRYPGEIEALRDLKAAQIPLVTTLSPGTAAATQFGVNFGPPIYYDTQRFLVNTARIKQLSDLKGRLVCVIKLSDPEQTMRDELMPRGITYGMIEETEQGEMDAAVAVSHCSGTGLESRLAQSQQGFHARIANFGFLPERFGLDPVSPAYLYGDQKFGLIVDWTIYALIEAEALGITQANVADAGKREDLRAVRLLGGDPETAHALGLAPDWAAKVIAGVGNYGEIFAHTVGEPYGIDRGLNKLWTEGGLMRPLPMR